MKQTTVKPQPPIIRFRNAGSDSNAASKNIVRSAGQFHLSNIEYKLPCTYMQAVSVTNTQCCAGKTS